MVKNKIENLLGNNIPWDCLTERNRAIVKKYFYEDKDFKTIAKEMNIRFSNDVKFYFYSSLTKLSKISKIRELLSTGGLKDYEYLLLSELFFYNKTLKEYSEKQNMNPYYTHSMISDIFKKYNITWKVFVKRVDQKKKIYDETGNL